MKFTNAKKVTLATTATMLMSSAVVNATVSDAKVVSKTLGDWVTVVAEVLSILCLVVFALYLGKLLSIKEDKDLENDEKVAPKVKNCMMTALVGIALCQAAIVIVQLFF